MIRCQDEKDLNDVEQGFQICIYVHGSLSRRRSLRKSIWSLVLWVEVYCSWRKKELLFKSTEWTYHQQEMSVLTLIYIHNVSMGLVSYGEETGLAQTIAFRPNIRINNGWFVEIERISGKATSENGRNSLQFEIELQIWETPTNKCVANERSRRIRNESAMRSWPLYFVPS